MAKTIPINLFRVVGTKSKLTTDSNSSSKRRHQLLQQNYENIVEAANDANNKQVCCIDFSYK